MSPRTRLCVAIAAALLLSAESSAAGEQWAVSIRSLALEKGERVVGFEVTFKGAAIASLPLVPVGWSIAVDNDPSWNTKVTASVQVGAAAIGGEFFRDFIVVERGGSPDPKLLIRGTVVATKDFEKERRIELKLQDFVLRKVRAKQP